MATVHCRLKSFTGKHFGPDWFLLFISAEVIHVLLALDMVALQTQTHMTLPYSDSDQLTIYKHGLPLGT